MDYGGGVSVWDSSNVYISENTTFSGNSAIDYGGGVSVWDSSNVYVSGNAVFNNNSVCMHGGGVHTQYIGGGGMSTSVGIPLFSGNSVCMVEE